MFEIQVFIEIIFAKLQSSPHTNAAAEEADENADETGYHVGVRT